MDEVEGIDVVQYPRREEIQEMCQKMCSWERYVVFSRTIREEILFKGRINKK